MTPTARFVNIKNIILEHLNASVSTYGTYSTNPRYKRELIMDGIINADYDFAVAICLNGSHPERPRYAMSPTTVTESPSGSKTGRIPASTGDVDIPQITRSDSVIVTGRPASANWIDMLNADSGNLFGTVTIKEGFYWVGNGLVKWTGSSCSFVTFEVQHGSWSGSAGSEAGTTRSPEQCESAIAALVLARLYSKQEDMMEASKFYLEQASVGLSAIAENGLPINKLEQYKQARG
jgi:hypothetical protein